MRDNYDFSGAIKNPFAEKIKKEGYSVTIHYGKAQSDWDEVEEVEPSADEMAAFEEYRAAKAQNA